MSRSVSTSRAGNEMVAYSFQAQFLPPIAERTKQSTLRAPSNKRLPRVGGSAQLYYGMRTKFCRLVGTATVLKVETVRIDFYTDSIFYPSRVENELDHEAFAVTDGFANWDDLSNWFRDRMPGIAAWRGNRIFWGDTFVPATAKVG